MFDRKGNKHDRRGRFAEKPPRVAESPPGARLEDLQPSTPLVKAPKTFQPLPRNVVVLDDLQSQVTAKLREVGMSQTDLDEIDDIRDDLAYLQERPDDFRGRIAAISERARASQNPQRYTKLALVALAMPAPAAASH